MVVWAEPTTWTSKQHAKIHSHTLYYSPATVLSAHRSNIPRIRAGTLRFTGQKGKKLKTNANYFRLGHVELLETLWATKGRSRELEKERIILFVELQGRKVPILLFFIVQTSAISSCASSINSGGPFTSGAVKYQCFTKYFTFFRWFSWHLQPSCSSIDSRRL